MAATNNGHIKVASTKCEKCDTELSEAVLGGQCPVCIAGFVCGLEPPGVPQRANRAETLFYQALALPPGEREAFLREVCGPDASLRAEVDGYLHHYEQAGSILKDESSLSPELEAEFARLKPEEAGERIGPYKLLEQIGEGGFGTVWVAEQEKPIRRRVALKIIKLGMDTKDVVARFEQERQALAMMDHPNIAKVLDAGATPFGRPFFAMELVRGVKITDYCNQAKLPTAERLRLFIDVCHAVQHAHQKGIIHRDLKPSNILVTINDGKAVPKVIDFGVAKATQQQRLTDLTIYTQFQQMIGTPLYMSPEQAELTSLDIDTRSDIYSLGVLLYELLTGRTPFDPEKLMKQGYDEIRRVIREEEPPKPSTLVSTLAVEARTNLAQHRQTDGARLIGQIRGDLDWIVMKALEKDRSRRYETASGLAKDIERHLSSEPVQARPPTSLYRFRRFARRNKLAFAAATAVILALLIGLGASTWMFFQEKQALSLEKQARERSVAAEKAQNEERKKAVSEAAKSRQVAKVLTDMLEGVAPAVARGRDTTMLREMLDKTADSLGNDLKNHPDVEANLRNIIGNLYKDLGEYDRAVVMWEKVLAIRRKLRGNEHPEVAMALHNMAVGLSEQGKLVEAETMFREALTMQRKLVGNEHREIARLLNDLTSLLIKTARVADAETTAREALAMQKKLVGLGNEGEGVTDALNNLANVLFSQGKLVEAETMFRDVLGRSRKLHGNEHPEVAISLHNLATVLENEGKEDEAEAMFREALTMGKKLLGNEHPDVAKTLGKLANVLRNKDKTTEAETMLRDALTMQRKSLGSEHPDIFQTLNNLSIVLYNQGKLVEAETMLRDVLERSRKQLGNGHPQVASSLHNLASVLDDEGKRDEAEAMYRESLAITRNLHGNDHPAVALTLNSLAKFLRDQGKLKETEAMLREALAINQKRLGNDHPEVTTTQRNLAWTLKREGKLAESETFLRKALAALRKTTSDDDRDVVKCRKDLADVLRRQDKLTELEVLQREALAIARRSATSDPSELETGLHELADVLYRQGKYGEAEPLYREEIKSQEARSGAEEDGVVNTHSSLARLLADWAWADRHQRADVSPLPTGSGSEVKSTGPRTPHERAQEAERLLRTYVAPRERSPKGSQAVDNRGLLGGAVLAVAVTDPGLTIKSRGAKFTEAESLLLAANEDLEKSDKAEGKCKRDALTRIVRLYEAWDKADKVAVWQQKLTDFDKANANTDNLGTTVLPTP